MGPSNQPPSVEADRDGVRVIHFPAPPRGRATRRRFAALVAGMLLGGVGWLYLAGSPDSATTSDSTLVKERAPSEEPRVRQADAKVRAGAVRVRVRTRPNEVGVAPGEGQQPLAEGGSSSAPAKTVRQLPEALESEAGEPSGIALFPPPGTNPPKEGLIVPDDFELPPGYVRHYQVTDDGKPLPPILMFHPDAEIHDEQGNPIPLPPDLVVPPELAPPGFPVEKLHVPEPQIPFIEVAPSGDAVGP